MMLRSRTSAERLHPSHLVSTMLLAAAAIAPLAAIAETAYIANSAGHDLTLLDTTSATTIGSIPVGAGPAQLALTHAGDRIYATSVADESVAVIDTATNAVIDTIALGERPAAIGVTPDGTRLYVLVEGGTVSVIDTELSAPIASIPVLLSYFGTGFGVAITPDGGRAYVASGALSVIDVATQTVVATPYLGLLSSYVTMSPDGSVALVSNALGDDLFSGTVSVLDATDAEVIATIPFLSMPGSAAFLPDGSRAYIASPYVFVSTGYGSAWIEDRTLVVIDTSNWTEITRIILSDTPSGVAVNGDGTRAYVTSGAGNLLDVVDTTTNTVLTSVPLGAGPAGIVVAETSAPDSDADGILDAADNCTRVANSDQRDTNADGYGNACDADLNGDCIVNSRDVRALKTIYRSHPDADFDGNGVVNAADAAIMRAAFHLPPGPSGLSGQCPVQ